MVMELSDLKRIIIPTRYQAIICSAVSLAVLIISSFETIYGRYISQSFLAAPEFKTSFTTQLNRVSQINLVDKFVVIIFWSGLGLLAYTIIWGLVNVMIEARNEVVVETAYTNRSRFLERLSRPLHQAGVAGGLIVFLIICAKFLIPLWLLLFHHFILAPISLDGLAQGVGAWLGFAAMIYALWMGTEAVFAAN